MIPLPHLLLSTLLSASSPHLLCPLRSTSQFPFRKHQASQGSQPNIACQVAKELSTVPIIKAGLSDPMGRKGFPKHIKGSKQILFPFLGVAHEHLATHL